MSYQQSIGAHAPGHLRAALLEYLDEHWWEDTVKETVEVLGEERPLRWLLDQLWNCTDIVPWEYCERADIPHGSSYAVLVREVALSLEPSYVPENEDQDTAYLHKCAACGEWGLHVEHVYVVNHGSYWKRYVEWAELSHEYPNELVVIRWSDPKVVDAGCDDGTLGYDDDQYFLVCGSCRERIDLGFDRPRQADEASFESS